MKNKSVQSQGEAVLLCHSGSAGNNSSTFVMSCLNADIKTRCQRCMCVCCLGCVMSYVTVLQDCAMYVCVFVCVDVEGCEMSYVTVLQETVQCLAFVNERISKQMIKVCYLYASVGCCCT